MNNEELIKLREYYTKETYSPVFTRELLHNLYNFITSDMVQKLQLFSEYDKASLLCAMEYLDKYNNLNNKIEKMEKTISEWHNLTESRDIIPIIHRINELKNI